MGRNKVVIMAFTETEAKGLASALRAIKQYGKSAVILDPNQDRESSLKNVNVIYAIDYIINVVKQMVQETLGYEDFSTIHRLSTFSIEGKETSDYFERFHNFFKKLKDKLYE